MSLLRSRRIIVDAALAALGAAVALPLLLAVTMLGFLLLALATGLRFTVPLLLDVGGPDADGAVVTTGPLFAVAGALAFVGVAVLLFWARRRDPARRRGRAPSAARKTEARAHRHGPPPCH